MTRHATAFRLLLVGIVPRLMIAALMIAALWLGFFFVTLNPGAL